LQKSGQRAALWVFGTVLDLGTLGGPQSYGHGLLVRHWPDPHLNHVYVVGESEMPTGGYLGSHAFVYNRGTITDLGMPPGFVNARAYGINRRQEIVGYATDATGTFHAMLWRRGRMYDLNTLVEPGSTCRSLLIAYAINDRGEIVGYGDCKGGGAFKLTP
jgi:probable HAF family extracellular repeat protein